MNAQIAQHLNVAETAILEVQEWAKVLWVRVRGIGARFVSKKVVKVEKKLVSSKEGALILAQMVNGKVWDKKEGEVRVYVGKGYLRVAPETASTSQVQYFCKSYEIPAVKPSVEAFNELYTVSASVGEPKQRILMQEDEDGVIAPLGQHEAGVHIVKEWYIER